MISVIIVNYNSADLIKRAVDSVFMENEKRLKLFKERLQTREIKVDEKYAKDYKSLLMEPYKLETIYTKNL